MRLGEVKKIVQEIIDTDGVIQINHTSMYSDQAHKVGNFRALIDALNLLKSFSWNDSDHAQIAEILTQKPDLEDSVILVSDQFNQLRKYIDSVNKKLPFFVSILETMIEDQDEKLINIKLSNSIQSLEELQGFIGRISSILKKVNIDGEFVFKGFDKGTSWLEVGTIGLLSYQHLVGCLEVVTAYFDMKTAFHNAQSAEFGAKQAEVEYRAALIAAGHGEEFSKEGVEKYIEQKLEQVIKNRLEKLVRGIGNQNGRQEQETVSFLMSATKDIVKEVQDGTEFHLSLNPPEYAREHGGLLTIDYKKIKMLATGNTETPQQLDSGIQNTPTADQT